VQAVRAALREVGPKAVTSDVGHFVFVGQRGDGALWVFAGEGLEEEDEVCEAAADGEGGALEGLEVGLRREERVRLEGIILGGQKGIGGPRTLVETR
jgi:hypothetical protein